VKTGQGDEALEVWIKMKYQYIGSSSMLSLLMLSATYSDQISEVPFAKPFITEKQSVIAFIRLILSVSLCPKVITLSCFRWNSYFCLISNIYNYFKRLNIKCYNIFVHRYVSWGRRELSFKQLTLWE
jgi:hypothetical protein